MIPPVEFVDTPTAPEDVLHAMHDLYVARDIEEPPHDVMPAGLRLAFWRHVDPADDVPRWVVRDGGTAIAMSGAYMSREQDLENAFAWVYVHPDFRGQGLGRRVAAPMLDYVEADNRTRIAVDIVEGRSEVALAERAGLARVYEEKMSRLLMADLDWDLMQSWIDRAAERAGDYDLLALDSPIPEEHLERFAEATKIMHTAPKEDAIEEDIDISPEMWRDIERTEAGRQRQMRLLIAVHRPTGDFAGYTILNFQALRPDQAWQFDTGVDPAHRDRGLGRWLKAAMITHARDTHPEVEFVDTFNAGSNEPMLNINLAMGFKPVRISHAYQGPLAGVRERLAV